MSTSGVHPSQESLGPQSRDRALACLALVPNEYRDAANALFDMYDHDFFWTYPRKVQVIVLLFSAPQVIVPQCCIAIMMGVSDATVTKYKKAFEDHPDDLFPPPGRPSPIRPKFQQVKRFVAQEIGAGRSVTLGVLMEFVVEELEVNITRRRLREYMTSHGFSYVSGTPAEDVRVQVNEAELERFYLRRLPDDVNGVHPALVFNMDEMGAERFADRKRINVFLPDHLAPVHGGILVGVPRSSRRCTLIACIAMDGSTLDPAIITRTRRMNSAVFEKGYGKENLTVFSTKNSFITSEVFGLWLQKIFLPYVENRRAQLRRRLGQFNEDAVLIMDMCSCHTAESHVQALRARHITVTFLVPHTSHLTQPLDLGVFGRVKSILRDEATYAIDLDGVDEMVAESIEPDEDPRRPRAPQGLALAEYILDILDAFEVATTRRRVDSAFAQAGFSTCPPTPTISSGRSPTSTPQRPAPSCARPGSSTGGRPLRGRHIFKSRLTI